jgi:hypothetical protein
MYLQFATLHKCFDTILISSALLLVVFGRYPIFFDKFLEIIHYLPAIFPLFLLNYSVPLPVARWNDIVFVRVMCGIRLGATWPWSDIICSYWTGSWHGDMLLSLLGACVAWLWYFLILLPGHLIWCLINTLSYKSFSVVLPAKIFSR